MASFAVIGTGIVGQVISSNLASLGHEVFLGTRNPVEAAKREDLSEWISQNPKIPFLPFAEAVVDASSIVNALPGNVSVEVLASLDPKNLADKVLIDISNPLDFSQGFPPSLFVKDTDSLAEQIQRAIPRAKVVKTLNTMTAHWMAPKNMDPNKEFSVFISGDDGEAKSFVREILIALGHKDIIDLGDLSSARAAEMLLPMWLRLAVAMDSYSMNFKIIR